MPAVPVVHQRMYHWYVVNMYHWYTVNMYHWYTNACTSGTRGHVVHGAMYQWYTVYHGHVVHVPG